MPDAVGRSCRGVRASLDVDRDRIAGRKRFLQRLVEPLFLILSRRADGCVGGSGRDRGLRHRAVVAHLEGRVVTTLVPKLLESAQLTRFEVYGDPGRRGSEILSRLGAELFPDWHAIDR